MTIIGRLLQIILPQPLFKPKFKKTALSDSQANFIDEPIGVKSGASAVKAGTPQPENKSFIASLVESAGDAIIGKTLDGRHVKRGWDV